MNIAETLRRAKDEIDTRGWCRGAPLDDQGRVCAIGALWFASGGSEDDWDQDQGMQDQGMYSLQNYIHNVIRGNPAALYLVSCLTDSGGTTSQIWYWNDDAASAEEVKDGLEAAALKWEQENS